MKIHLRLFRIIQIHGKFLKCFYIFLCFRFLPKVNASNPRAACFQRSRAAWCVLMAHGFPLYSWTHQHRHAAIIAGAEKGGRWNSTSFQTVGSWWLQNYLSMYLSLYQAFFSLYPLIYESLVIIFGQLKEWLNNSQNDRDVFVLVLEIALVWKWSTLKWLDAHSNVIDSLHIWVELGCQVHSQRAFPVGINSTLSK